MNRTQIKICGITNVEDATLCHGAGADFLGLIFAESKRKVSLESALKIRQAVPEAKLVGVFMDKDLQTVSRLTKDMGLNGIQLHGEEPDSYCEKLKALSSLLVVKALRREKVKSMTSYENPDLFLLDLDKRTPKELRDEETRRLWLEASRIQGCAEKIMLAGNLSPGNVKKAICRVRPFAVDICSGLEKSPGVKDRYAVKKFVEEVKNASR